MLFIIKPVHAVFRGSSRQGCISFAFVPFVIHDFLYKHKHRRSRFFVYIAISPRQNP